MPMVLNRSFNENEPVVCRPEGECFAIKRSGILADPRLDADLRMAVRCQRVFRLRAALKPIKKAMSQANSASGYPRRSGRKLYELAGIVAGARSQSKGKLRQTSRHWSLKAMQCIEAVSAI